jgi:hypothetical protein
VDRNEEEIRCKIQHNRETRRVILPFFARFAKIRRKNRTFDTGNINSFFSILIATNGRIARNISLTTKGISPAL